MERLKGKTAMVVGAGSIGPGWGNGKATAATFAREGAQVFCVDRNAAAAKETVDIITGEGGKATAFTADVSREAEVEAMVPVGLGFYAGICGWTLARAHARSGDPIAIATYLGEDDQFDRSITDFSQRYADQNDHDHQAFAKAIRTGRLTAHEGV